jgi:hypothetical protein
MSPILRDRINTLIRTLDEQARPHFHFVLQPGRVYARIARVGNDNRKSVHAFVRMADGKLLKAASWGQPAKGVRYDLLDSRSYAEVLRVAEPTTGYLYLR